MNEEKENHEHVEEDFSEESAVPGEAGADSARENSSSPAAATIRKAGQASDHLAEPALTDANPDLDPDENSMPELESAGQIQSEADSQDDFEDSEGSEGSEDSEDSKSSAAQTLDLSRSRLIKTSPTKKATSTSPEPTSEREEKVDGGKAQEAGEAGEGEEEEARIEEGEEALVGEVDPERLRKTVEALLFAAESPLMLREIARAASSRSPAIRKVLKALKESYVAEDRPWQLVEVAGGFRLVTKPEFIGAIQKLKSQTAQRKLTQAALETLALIAYNKEPISRADIENVRGVGAGPVLRQLLDRKLVKIAGRGTGLGQPLLYTVTTDFLEYFGLKSIDQLPREGEFKSA